MSDEEQARKDRADETGDPSEAATQIGGDAPTPASARVSAAEPVDEAAPTEIVMDDEPTSLDVATGEPAAGAFDGEVDVDAATRVSDRQRAPAARRSRQRHVEPGDVLFGEYEIIEVLGAGGMGEVYRARHRRLDEYRAIKMMHAELSGKQGANEFFLREAKALLAVRHPAVAHCHDLLSDESGAVYLIMEMIEGTPLSERIMQGPLSTQEVLSLGARISAGLAAAHKCGVVHRDVSPDNIVLPDGDVKKAKLIDFGIAKLLEEGQGTIVDGFKGKLGFASPEQLGFFGGKIDGRSDFYSLALVLCAAALGRSIGMGSTVVEAVEARRGLNHIPDQIPPALRSTIEPLLALDPRDRPERVERLFIEAGAEMTGLPTQMGGASVPAVVSDGGGAAVKWAAIVSAMAVIGIGGYLLVSGPGDVTTTASESLRPATEAADPPRNDAKNAAAPAQTAEAKPEPNPGPKPISALDRVRVVGLLRGAQTALDENRLQSPKGNNAYEKYIDVLEIDPANAEAKRGLYNVSSRYIALGERGLSSGRIDDARGYLARAATITPDHPDLGRALESLARAESGD